MQLFSVFFVTNTGHAFFESATPVHGGLQILLEEHALSSKLSTAIEILRILIPYTQGLQETPSFPRLLTSIASSGRW